MTDFGVVKLDDPDFDYLLIYLDVEDVTEALEREQERLRKVLNKKDYVYSIILDLLFITGNTENRFMQCFYCSGEFQLTFARCVKADLMIRQISSIWLHDHYEYVEYAPLIPRDKERIQMGLPL